MAQNNLPTDKTNLIVLKIKQKKELSEISNSVVVDELSRLFKREPKTLDKLNKSKNLEKSAVFEHCKKIVRENLRKYVGRFQIKGESDLLSTHSSTKERHNYYNIVYNKIFEITGRPLSVLDLGCGLNPLSYPDKSAKYFAADINDANLKVVKKYFEDNNIDGETFVYDLRNVNSDLPEVDVCFLFKVLDIIETKGHKLAEKIIVSLPCKYIVVSFSTTTLSGKPMKYASRGWIERLLDRLNFKWTKFEILNEVFYVIVNLEQ